MLSLIFATLFLNKKRTEHFIDVDKELFKSNVSLYHKKDDICNNFMNYCVYNQNSECKNVNLVACQKYKIKCENQCSKKNIDDNGKKETDLNKCLETCKQVQKNCCRRLKK